MGGKAGGTGTSFHMGMDGIIRNSEGRVIDLRDSGDFGNNLNKKKKKSSHISNQDILNNRNKNTKRGSKGFPLK
jgi:predicted HicB family RNase H-like nuclease